MFFYLFFFNVTEAIENAFAVLNLTESLRGMQNALDFLEKAPGIGGGHICLTNGSQIDSNAEDEEKLFKCETESETSEKERDQRPPKRLLEIRAERRAKRLDSFNDLMFVSDDNTAANEAESSRTNGTINQMQIIESYVFFLFFFG